MKIISPCVLWFLPINLNREKNINITVHFMLLLCNYRMYHEKLVRKYFLISLILIIICFSIEGNGGPPPKPKEPNWEALSISPCCIQRLEFAKKCWKFYKPLKSVFEKYMDELSETGELKQLESIGNAEQNNQESMPMSFQYSTHTIVLFEFWETNNATKYYLTLVVCFFFGIISVILKILRLHIEASLKKTTKSNIFTSRELLKNNTIRMIVSFFIYSWDYLLMLIVMTFNVGLFISVSLGLAMGFFLFGNQFVKSKKCGKNKLEVHTQFNADPACCGC